MQCNGCLPNGRLQNGCLSNGRLSNGRLQNGFVKQLQTVKRLETNGTGIFQDWDAVGAIQMLAGCMF